LRDDWHIEDVIEQAENMNIELTENQALEVLYEIAKYHDCNIGINWLVIDSAIDSVLGESK
jgi:hypothetical protein